MTQFRDKKTSNNPINFWAKNQTLFRNIDMAFYV